MDRLSADQNGHAAPSVPGKGLAEGESTERTHNLSMPSASVATKSSIRPSGEILATSLPKANRVPAGGRMEEISTGGRTLTTCKYASNRASVRTAHAPTIVRAKRKNVAAGIRLFSLHLLRGHVLKCSYQHAFCRQPLALDCHLGQCGRNGRGFLSQLGQTEIQQLRAGFGQHDVAGLQIAVNNSVTVRFVQSVCNLDSIGHCLRGWQRTLR